MLMSPHLNFMDFAMFQKMRMLESCTSVHKIDVGTCISGFKNQGRSHKTTDNSLVLIPEAGTVDSPLQTPLA